jgi:hypothetical protein
MLSAVFGERLIVCSFAIERITPCNALLIIFCKLALAEEL